MKTQTYHAEIKTLINAFVAAFDDVVINRYNDSGTIEKKIQVSYINAPKSRLLFDLINKEGKPVPIPIVSVMMTGLRRDSARQTDKHGFHMSDVTSMDSTVPSARRPIPVDLTISMSIIAKYQEDLDQIITNFAVYTDPYVVITWADPITGKNVDAQIMWNEDVTINQPVDLDEKAPYRITADTSFTIKGWLFKGANEHIGRIFRINTSFTAIPDIPCSYDDLLYAHGTENSEYFTIEGQPKLLFPNQHCYSLDLEPCSGEDYPYQVLCIQGSMLKDLEGVWLSGNNSVMFGEPEKWDVFKTSALSADNPPFWGVQIPTFNVTQQLNLPPASGDYYGNNVDGIFDTVCFTLPPLTASGVFDVIVASPAGYGILTRDSLRPTNNPYPEGYYLRDEYVEYQHPWVHGITVG